MRRPNYPSTRSEILDDFRRGTIGPMREAASEMRLIAERSLESIESTLGALAQANDLARTIHYALAVRRAMAGAATAAVDIINSPDSGT